MYNKVWGHCYIMCLARVHRMDQLPLDSLLVLVSFTMDVPLLLALHPPVSSSYSILLRQAAMNFFLFSCCLLHFLYLFRQLCMHMYCLLGLYGPLNVISSSRPISIKSESGNNTIGNVALNQSSAKQDWWKLVLCHNLTWVLLRESCGTLHHPNFTSGARRRVNAAGQAIPHR